MIPEGLQYQSAKQIAKRIKDMGLNVVRLTFPIELVDDIYNNDGTDVKLLDALTLALGTENGTAVYEQILSHNPEFNHQTTRLDLFDSVARALNDEGLLLHLDNHVSKAMWCCSLTDGNAWFGDTYFDVDNWIRGLSFMADHGAKHWPNFASIGLRNELRDGGGEDYLWSVWKKHMVDAANAVHAANPDILIFFSGLNYDVTLNPIIEGTVLGDGTYFHISDYDFQDKFVFELHTYDTVTNCDSFKNTLLTRGFNALNETYTNSRSGNVAPVVMTEWGHDQTDSAGKYDDLYHTCLQEFFTEQKAGYMLWVVAGSYYIRSGSQDLDETWGMLNHTWDGYRGEKSSQAFLDFVAATTNNSG